MIGFRKIYGANWLKQARTITIFSNGNVAKVEKYGKLLPHWNDVRNVLLNR